MLIDNPTITNIANLTTNGYLTVSGNSGLLIAVPRDTNEPIIGRTISGTELTISGIVTSINELASTNGFVQSGFNATNVFGGPAQFNNQVYTTLGTTNIPTGANHAIDWNNGNVQVLTLASATGTVVVTMSNPASGGQYLLKIIQHASSAKAITWPANVKWLNGITPTISTGASAVDLVSMVYDGTNYYANIGQNYS